MFFEEKDQDSALRNQSLFQDGKTSPKLDPSKGTIFEPASQAKLHSATAKNRDKATFATFFFSCIAGQVRDMVGQQLELACD